MTVQEAFKRSPYVGMPNLDGILMKNDLYGREFKVLRFGNYHDSFTVKDYELSYYLLMSEEWYPVYLDIRIKKGEK